MNNLKKIILAASLCLLSGVASAVPISGSILFNGLLTTDTDDVTDAQVFNIFSATATLGTGSFSTLTGQSVAFDTLDLGAALPLAPLWSGVGTDTTTFSFDLNSITSTIDLVEGTRTLSGVGDIWVSGVSESNWGWTFTTQNPGADETDPVVFSFSASQTNVPEPSMLLLLSTGIIGFGVARKLRKAA